MLPERDGDGLRAVDGMGASPPLPNPRTFPSMKAAAAWIVKEGLGRSFAGAQHSICEVCCGRRETAYGYLWRRA